MWWAPELLREDEDLEPVWRLDGFEELVAESERRMGVIRAGAEPLLQVLEPEGPRSGLVVLALHGRTASAQEALDAPGLRGAIVIGADDFRLDAARELAAAADEAGMPLRFDVVDGLDHAYPSDHRERLPGLLAFVAP